MRWPRSCCPRARGSIFSFDIKGGREAGRRFIERLKLFSHLANVGDAKSLVIHPASTTHAQLDAAALKEAGIGEGMIRLSVGLEDPDDLLDDLGQALRAAAEGLTMKLTVNGRAVFATTGGTDFDPAKPAVDVPAWRGLRPHGVAPADALVRPSWPERAGGRLSRRTAGRTGRRSTASPRWPTGRRR